MTQQREVGANLRGIDDEGGGGDAGQVEAGKGSGIAGTGFHVAVKSCQTAMGPLKMKNAPAAIRPKPTRWFTVSFSPSQKTANPTNMIRVTTSCRPEEHTSELQSLMRTAYAGFCLQKTQK